MVKLQRVLAFATSKLAVEPVPKSNFYRVVKDWEFWAEGKYWPVPKGFEFDGASIPRIFWTLLGVGPFHPDVIEAACAHDWFYLTHKISRRKTDRVFKDLLIRRGIGLGKMRINLMWLAVRTPAGAFAWRRNKKDKARLILLKMKISKRDDRERFFDYGRRAA
jgi:hypothetical protein